MKTNITKYTRGDKTIIFVGMIHIASDNYYRKIKSFLKSYPDGCVLYEGVGNKDKNQDIIKYAKDIKDFAKIVDLTYQGDAIDFKNSNWVNSDLDFSLLESISGKDVLPKLELDLEFLAKNKKLTKNVFKLGMRFITPIISFIDDAVIIDIRNNKVLTDAFSLLKDNDDVVINYGQGHEPGISKYLKRVGFNKEIIERIGYNI